MSDKIHLNARYGFREDTLENWQAENPVLEKGEPSIVRDPTEPSEWLKIGDGETAWNDLPYKKGPQGLQGERGEQGFKGDKGDKGDPGVVEFKVVDELPEIGNENIMYLVLNATAQNQNNFDEYIFTNGTWEKIGTASVEVDLTDYVKNTDYATSNNAGVMFVNTSFGIDTFRNGGWSGFAKIIKAEKTDIDAKTNTYKPIVPNTLDYAIKAGLSNNKLEWTEEEKQAARELVGAVGNTDYATADNVGVIKTSRSRGLGIDANGTLYIDSAGKAEILAKQNYRNPIVPNTLDYAVKVGMTTNQETWTEEEKQAARELVGAIGDTDYATSTKGGVVRISSSYGFSINANGVISLTTARLNDIDNRTGSHRPIVPSNLDYAVKKALSDCKLDDENAWSEEEKQSARNLIGVTEIIGDIDSALDELHNYAQGLIGGAE